MPEQPEREKTLRGKLIGIDALLVNALVVADGECALRLVGARELVADSLAVLEEAAPVGASPMTAHARKILHLLEFPMPEQPEREKNDARQSTDRELWRERPDDYYADSLHVTAQGGIGINHGGRVIVLPLWRWHELAMNEQELAWRVLDLKAQIAALSAAAPGASLRDQGERELLHAIIQDCHAIINPEEHPELCERIDAVLLPCDNAGRCVGIDDALVPAAPAPAGASLRELRAAFTDEVIRAIRRLAGQQYVRREQDDDAALLTGPEAARDYIVELVREALASSPTPTATEAHAQAVELPPCPACRAYALTKTDRWFCLKCRWTDREHSAASSPTLPPDDPPESR